VYVAAGNLDGLGGDEIITGAGGGGGGHVRSFDGTGTPVANIMAFDGFAGEARVATTDRDGDGRDDLVVGAGPGGQPAVRILSGLSLSPLDGFFAYGAAFGGGVFVG